MYVKSSNIKLFPLAKARDSQRSSRIFYEETTSSLIRNFIDTTGFIVKNKDNSIPQLIKEQSNDWKLNNDLNFNIYGYYVTIQDGTIFDADLFKNNYVYATIELRGKNGVPYEIDGQDELELNGNYTGLKLSSSTSKPDPYTFKEGNNGAENTITVNLVLFKRNSTNGYELYEDSYQKIDISALQITGIDGCH